MMTDDLYLAHHGVKGMRWGVRRYEKKVGTYTQRGVAKTKQSLEKYDAAKKQYDAVKKSNDKAAISKAKNAMGSAKQDLNKSYKKLKTAAKADKGRELYQNGKTITGISNRQMLGNLGIAIGTNALRQMTVGKNVKLPGGGNITLNAMPARTVKLGLYAINNISAEMKKSNLRAYYAH